MWIEEERKRARTREIWVEKEDIQSSKECESFESWENEDSFQICWSWRYTFQREESCYKFKFVLKNEHNQVSKFSIENAQNIKLVKTLQDDFKMLLNPSVLLLKVRQDLW